MADLTDIPDIEDDEEYDGSEEEDTPLTLESLQEIHDDEDKLNALKDRIQQGYAALCALCAHPMEDDDEAEDDDDEDDETDHEMSSRKDLILRQQIAVQDYDLDLEPPEEEEILIPGIGGSKEDDKEINGVELTCAAIVRKITQASHPDKIMRFSAEAKVKIIACFHNALVYLYHEDLNALVLCYIRVFLLRGEAFKISRPMFKLAQQRHNDILHNMRFLAQRPYINAIEAYFRGEKRLAQRLFQQYLDAKKKEKDEDFDVSLGEDGEVYFEYDDTE